MPMMFFHHRSSCSLLLLMLMLDLDLSSHGSNQVSSIIIIPTFSHDPVNSSSNEYHTLDEWIINSSSKLFASNTKVVLLSGVHEVSSSQSYVEISDVHSLTITGQNSDNTHITCNTKFYFHFMFARNIKLSNFTITNCAYMLEYMTYGDVQLLSTLYQAARVETSEFSFVFSDSDNIAVEGISILEKGGVFIHHTDSNQVQSQSHEMLLYSTVDFLNNNISIMSGAGLCFVIPKYILKPVMNLTITNNTSNACFLVKILSSSKVKADLRIINLKIWNPKCELFDVLSAEVLRNVHLENITVHYGKHSHETYFSVTAQSVAIFGNLFINYNKFGRTMIACTESNITVNPGSSVHIANNDIQWKVTFINLLYILLSPQSHLTIQNSTLVFDSNKVTRGRIFQVEGGRITTSASRLTFTNNLCGPSDKDEALQTTVFMLQTTKMELIRSKILFENNTASGLSAGITLIKGSNIYCVLCELKFLGNRGGDGGAISFYGKSQIRFARQTCSCIILENNWASGKGGGIYVEDSDYMNLQDMVRFYDYGYSGDYTFNEKYGNITTYFNGNHAEVAGNDLYGGWIDQRTFFKETIWPVQSYDFQAIASDPIRVCICVNSSVQCSIIDHVTQAIPGEVLSLDLVAVGQRYGIVPSKVLISPSGSKSSSVDKQGVYTVERKCSELRIPIKSNKSILVLQLFPEGSSERINRIGWSAKQSIMFTAYRDIFTQLNVIIHIKDCPLGFKLDNSIGTCVCLESGENPRFTCNISSFEIIIPQQKWINATFIHVVANKTYGVIVHNHCPYDFCKSVRGAQSIKLEHPGDQCSYLRSGILCGKCQSGLSNILGSSNCRECSSYWLLAVIPGVALAGLLLLLFLTVLNLTVSDGTINGVIFYANIVRANQAILITQNSLMHSFLRYFFAWINLDLGIETCFYNGFDAYAMTWLQFIFPMYIWSIMSVIIVCSHYSTTVSKLSGNNAVSVLATLFLLSYTKILRTVITVFSSTTLEYPDGFSKRVWLYDGNVEFLKGKHIPLFIMAMFTLLVLSIPYTLSLVMLQWLRKISHYRILFWVGTLMPIFDSYVGPYKYKHCYWTGLLLLVRVAILLVLSLNQSNNPAHNFTAIGCIMFFLLAYLSFFGGVCRTKIVNILEIVMILNLGLLSFATLHNLQTLGSSTFIANTSTGITFTLFSLIVLCHAWQRLISTQTGRNIKSWIGKKNCTCCKRDDYPCNSDHSNDNCDQIENKTAHVITHTSLELKESLLGEEHTSTQSSVAVKT